MATMPRQNRIAALIAFVASATVAIGASQQAVDHGTTGFNVRAAAAYLDARAEWWAAWPNAARDRGTFCISCHTTLPYALARPSMRATLGEGLARGVSLKEQSWVQFIERSLADQKLGPTKHDLGLLLITVEGILHHHILSTAHYKKLFGRDLSDPRIRERTKQHLQRAILALVESGR